MPLALLIRVVVIAVSLWVATLIVPGIDDGAGAPAHGSARCSPSR